MLAELAPDGWRLPELHDREEMTDEGLIEAMSFLLDPGSTASNRRRISRDELEALRTMAVGKECSANVSHSASQFRDLRATWFAAFTECQEAIPYAW